MPGPPLVPARERLAARARRVAAIRRRVLVATLAAFALAWGVIAFDGSMGAAATTASTQAATGSSSASSADATSGSSSSAESGSSADSAPLTTAQS